MRRRLQHILERIARQHNIDLESVTDCVRFWALADLACLYLTADEIEAIPEVAIRLRTPLSPPFPADCTEHDAIEQDNQGLIKCVRDHIIEHAVISPELLSLYWSLSLDQMLAMLAQGQIESIEIETDKGRIVAVPLRAILHSEGDCDAG